MTDIRPRPLPTTTTAVAVTGVLVLLLAAVSPAAGQSTAALEPLRLRPPSGPHPVGRRTLFLVDSTRGEPSTADTSDRRELAVTIWYPAKAGSGTPAGYMASAGAYAGAASGEAVAAWKAAVTLLREDAAIATGAPFPVLLFSHGWSARAGSYSIVLADIASHGFIVVGIDHPYMGAVATANGSVTKPDDSPFSVVRGAADLYYSQDVAYVRSALGRWNTADPVLRGSIRTDAVFAAGHSSGFGNAASAYAQRYRGLRGLISFDAGVSSVGRARGTDVPLLLFRAEDPSYTDILVRGPKTHPRGSIYDSSFVRATTAPFLDLQILRTGHDAVFDNLTAQRGAGGDDVRAVHDLMARYAVAFLRSALTGTAALTVRNEDTERVRLRLVQLPKHATTTH